MSDQAENAQDSINTATPNQGDGTNISRRASPAQTDLGSFPAAPPLTAPSTHRPSTEQPASPLLTPPRTLTGGNEIPKHEKPWKHIILDNKIFRNVGCGLAFATITFTVLVLVPAFSGQKISKESLELAKWTAWKEFIEKCNEVVASAQPLSPACQRAIGTDLPPPPHMRPSLIARALGRLMKTSSAPEHEAMYPAYLDVLISVTLVSALWLLLLTFSWLYRTSISQFVRLTQQYWASVRSLMDSPNTQDSEGESSFLEPPLSDVACPAFDCRELRFLTAATLIRHQTEAHGVRFEDSSDPTRDSAAQTSISSAVDQDVEPKYLSRGVHSTSNDIQWSDGLHQAGNLLRDRQPLPAHAPLGRWFVSGDGISRDVIEEQIQGFLGPDATVKPGMGIGPQSSIEGYWINAYRTFTSHMLDDLRDESARRRDGSVEPDNEAQTSQINGPSILPSPDKQPQGTGTIYFQPPNPRTYGQQTNQKLGAFPPPVPAYLQPTPFSRIEVHQRALIPNSTYTSEPSSNPYYAPSQQPTGQPQVGTSQGPSGGNSPSNSAAPLHKPYGSTTTAATSSGYGQYGNVQQRGQYSYPTTM